MGAQVRLLAICLLAVALAPVVHAASIDRMSLQWQGHEVTTISPTKSLPGTVLAFGLSGDFAACFNGSGRCAVQLESADIGLQRQTIEVRSCENGNGTITCETSPFTFRTANESNTITYVTQIGTAWQPPATAALGITLDRSNPQLTAVETGYCDGEICYVAANVPTPLTVTFEDRVTAFDYRLVFLGKAGSASVAMVQECTGASCEGEIIIPCSDGERFSIELKSAGGVSSREDAQNDVFRPAEPKQFVCRTEGPAIQNLTYAADGIAGQAVSGGGMTVKARVVSALAPSGSVNVSGILNMSEALTATCVPASDTAASDIHECTWQLSGLQPGTFDLEFRVQDPIGLYGSRTQKMTVLHLRMPPGNKTPDLYSATVGTVNPERINRMALDLARSNHLPYPSYVPYTLSAKRPTAKLYRQELKECVYKLANETNYTADYGLFSFGGQPMESRVLYPDGGAGKNRLDLQIRADRDILAINDTFQVECLLHLTVGDGNGLYDIPEVEPVRFEIKLRESALGQPGGAFVKKIKHEEERLSGTNQEFLQDLREARATMDGICTTVEAINGAISLLETAHTALFFSREAAEKSGVGAAAAPALEAARQSVDAANEGVKSAKDPAWFLSKGWIREVCYQVNCRGNVNHGITETLENTMPDLIKNTCGDAVQSAGPDASAGGMPMEDICSGITMPNPEDSFVMSALSLCTGGMIYNAGKWQDINCGYLQCLKEQSLSGSSTAVCEAAKSSKMCTQFVGEVFELPFLNIITNLAENINGIVEALPQYVLKWGANYACEKQPATFGQYQALACRWLRVTFDALDYADATRRGFDAPMSDNAICLQALCNKDDPDCDLSYNKAESITEYASYLQINSWLVDQKKKTGTTPKGRSEATKLVAELDAEWLDYCADKRCGPDGYHLDVVVAPQSEEFHYRLVSNADGSASVRLPPAYADTMSELSIDPSALDSADDYATARKMIDEGIIPKSQTDIDSYRESAPQIAADPQTTQQLERIREINSMERLEYQRQKLLEKRTQRLSDGKPVDILNARISEIDSEQQRIGDKLESEGYTWNPDADARWTRSFVAKGGDFTAAANADPDLAASLRLEESDGKYICGADCKNHLDTCAPTCDGYTISGALDGDITIKRDITGDVESGTQAKPVKEITAFQRIMVSVLVQIARDKGYLDWLSISHYGDWGIDLIDQSNTYLTKEGWSRNICNEAKFDINDNSDGAIYTLSESDNPRPVGTFAAEIRRIENTSGKDPYVYMMTFLIDNPLRGQPAGVADKDWTERNTFMMDIRLVGLAECATGNCSDEYDLINGTYELTYGGKFASGDGPRRSLLYLPGRYERLCVTFDKEFPDSSGKKVYCRSTRTGFNRGDPVPQGQLPGLLGGTGGSSAPAGAGTGALAGDLG